MNTVENKKLEVIIEGFENMLKRLANKFTCAPLVTFEDLMNVGRLAIIKAVHSHNPDRGMLSTHVYTVAKNDMLRYYLENKSNFSVTIHNQKKDGERIRELDSSARSLNYDYDGGSLDMYSPAASGEHVLDEMIKEENLSKITKLVKNLPYEERFIIENSSICMGDMTLQEVGDKLGISKQTVSLKAHRIMNKLKNKMEDMR